MTTFKVKRKLEAWTAIFFALLILFGFVVIAVLEPEVPAKIVVAAFGLSIAAAMIWTSYSTVKEIKISADYITFSPANRSIPVQDIETFTVDWPEFLEQRNELSSLRFTMKTQRFMWFPFNILWIGNAASIRVYGVCQPAEFVDAIRQAISDAQK
ncbi:hypothetical protein [Cochlodiniinecator piscidefendens]|uniref:hypothetical protein n=1 Tax=Cochlodiniinecator piscidefendens TaxID=2715756 RepID=UPI00140E645A|nr:hypothetical protein [Cochlodiniinecator piscidefendens]